MSIIFLIWLHVIKPMIQVKRGVNYKDWISEPIPDSCLTDNAAVFHSRIHHNEMYYSPEDFIY